MDGWIKLHRSVLDWEWFRKPNMFQVFSYLVLSASHKPFRFEGNEYETGTLVTTISRISEDTGVSVKSVRNCLQRLSDTNEICKKGANRFTVITICNYDRYQDQEDDLGQTKGKQRANKGQTKGKQAEEKENFPPHPPIKEKEEEQEGKNIFLPLTGARVCASEGFVERFFSSTNQYNLQLFVEQLHRLDSDIKMIADLRPLVDDVMARWGLSDKHHYDYTDWAMHMQDTIRRMVIDAAKQKNTKQSNGTNGIQEYAATLRRRMAQQQEAV